MSEIKYKYSLLLLAHILPLRNMANAYCDGPNSHGNAQDDRLLHVVDPAAVNYLEGPVDEWDTTDGDERLIELDEAGAHMTPEQCSESNARFAAFCFQQERAVTRYRALHNQSDSDDSQGSANMRTRPLNSHFGSDGHQYNPYAPHTSEEYMLQEIEAGRMDPEMMDMPRRLPDPAQSPLLGNGSAPPLARIHAEGQPSWMAPGHRPPDRQSSNDRGVPRDVSDPHEASWFRHPYAGRTAVEDLSDEEYTSIYPAYLEVRESPSNPNSPNISPYPSLSNQDSRVSIPGPVTSSRDPPTLNESFVIGIPRQRHPAPIGRERKRLAQPSLVVKLKIHSPQKSLQASVPPKRGRLDAPSSSEAPSAAHVTQNARPFNLRSQGSVGLSSANAKTRVGWDPHAVRRLTRRAEAIQSSQRKRRRDAVSPQEVSAGGTTTPSAGLPQGKQTTLNPAQPC